MWKIYHFVTGSYSTLLIYTIVADKFDSIDYQKAEYLLCYDIQLSGKLKIVDYGCQELKTTLQQQYWQSNWEIGEDRKR